MTTKEKMPKRGDVTIEYLKNQEHTDAEIRKIRKFGLRQAA